MAADFAAFLAKKNIDFYFALWRI